MHWTDHLFMLLVFVALPIYDIIESRRSRARTAAGGPTSPVRVYAETTIIQWAFLAVFGISWWMLGRTSGDLGFRTLEGPALWGGTAVLLVMIGLLLVAWQTTRRASDEEKVRQLQGLGKMVDFLPRTGRDLRYMVIVSITAGIVEEIVCRGFAIWYLGSFMPLWAAVVVSSIGFGMMHVYLGVSGAVRAGLVGLGIAIFYVLTGSIWLPILAHIALDILQGLTARELFRTSGTPPACQLVPDSAGG